MNKINSKTLIERLGFNDKDLTTPEHDKMLLYLNQNWKDILVSLSIISIPSSIILMCPNRDYRDCEISSQNTYSKKKCDWSWEKNSCSFTSDLKSMQEELNEIRQIIRKRQIEKISMIPFISGIVTIEKAIMSNQFNVGFIDFSVEKVKFSIPEEKQRQYFHIAMGDIDQPLYFEIKPKIKSIGETMRQINMYRSHTPGIYIIMTKTKGMKELFKEQDVYIYEYENEENPEVTEEDVL